MHSLPRLPTVHIIASLRHADILYMDYSPDPPEMREQMSSRKGKTRTPRTATWTLKPIEWITGILLDAVRGSSWQVCTEQQGVQILAQATPQRPKHQRLVNHAQPNPLSTC